MIAAVVRNDLLGPLADQVQLLIDAEPKPSARKRKRRPRDGRQLQNVAIKPDAAVHVGNVQGHVVELSDEHCVE